jgi:catechol 2,3-dioxygenase-like lactoylglutathione lyase family enzyme
VNTPIKTPIKNRIGGVFIPVRDIEKAKKWYSKILGLEGGEIYFGHIYTAPMDGTAGLILDTMPKWRDENGNIPSLLWWSSQSRNCPTA